MSEQLVFEIESEMHRIFDFWRRLQDDRNGGYSGSVNYNLIIDHEAVKSGISAVRCLWSFSRAYHLTNELNYRKLADHAYAFIFRHLYDNLHGGLYWCADFEGDVSDDRKHIYLQAFAIYALSEYYLATGTRRAIELAMKIWQLVEDHGWNEVAGCYREEFSREWKEIDNELLSENGITADITANTHLHLLEAYTTLYRAVPTKPVKESLFRVLEIFANRIFSPETGHLKVFFNSNWNEIMDLKSYGHDIEASWLIDETLKLLSIKDDRFDGIVTGLAEAVLREAVRPDGSLVNESEAGAVDETRIWWVQAEAALGFYNAWEKTGDEKFYKAFIAVWNYIRDMIIDKRPGGEWLYGRDADGNSLKRHIVESWKAPYHNSRCCMELYTRLSK